MAFLNKLFGRGDRQDILVAFELHSVEQIRAALDAGLDPRAPIRGKSLVNWLTEMYIKLLIEAAGRTIPPLDIRRPVAIG